MKGYKKHPNPHESDVVIFETESIDEVNFIPLCLTIDAALVGTSGSLVYWKLETIHKYGIVKAKAECNSGYGITDQEFCVKLLDPDLQACSTTFGRGFFTKNDERWFLRGAVVKSIGFFECDVVVTDFSRVFSFITGNHSIDSFDSYGNDKYDLEVSLSSYSDLKCGDYNLASGLFYGGKRKRIKNWPWIAAMYVDEDYVCTASFISRTRAVTAAHCFSDKLEANDIKLQIFTKECKIVCKRRLKNITILVA